MTKPLLTVLLACSVLFSCTKNKQGLPEPLHEVIRSQTDCSCEPYINEYRWREQTIYVLAYKGPACTWIPTYYDGKGNIFNMEQGYTLDDFLGESSLIRHTWSCN
jgi:hypothetical protein